MPYPSDVHECNEECRDDFRKALNMEYLFVGYNVTEAVLAITFGIIAGSIALTGFGLDSIVESLSAIILVWRLKAHGVSSVEHEEKIERRARRFVAITFFILGAYVLVEAVLKLWRHERPDASVPGMVLATASIMIMPYLGKKKYELGKKIESKALIADSKETFVCATMSVALLVGLVVNAVTGFWQADPIIGMVIAGFLFKEGMEGLEDLEEEEEEEEEDRDEEKDSG